MKKFFYILTLLLSVFSVTAQHNCYEQILSLHSDITMHKNATLDIVETIQVNAQHCQIKRGITRAFPTKYKTRFSNHVVVKFDVKKVLMDGKVHPYGIRNVTNGKIVNFGDDKFITKGVHTYQISYQTDRQLTFKDHYAELYFNIVGNDVIFPILKATATIHLPENAPTNKIELEGYTGYFGSNHKNYQAWITDHNTCHFKTTQALLPKQSFTISVAFPNQGIIVVPSSTTKLIWFFKDNLDKLLALLCFFLLLIIYGSAWLQKQNRRPIIVPLFTPPKDMLPSDCNYVYYKTMSMKALTATVIDLAIKKYIKIKHNPGGWFKYESYTLEQQNNLSQENEIYSDISHKFFKKDISFKLGKKTYRTTQSVFSRLKNRALNLYGKFITNNYRVLAFGSITTTITIIILLWLQQSDIIILLIVAGILINLGAYFILREHTKDGKAIYAQIAGFKMYLSFVEKDRIERLNPPKMTTNLFEKYLSYAIALGVDKQWTQAFDNIFAQMATQGHVYHPYWYIGHRLNAHNISHNIHKLNTNLGSAITASSTPPGSRSGRGGGGFSGGGGGGGGIGGR
jgi:uncharacterized membrane protein